MDWIFFDIGSLLFNDDPQNYHSYRFMHRVLEQADPAYAFEHLLAEREEHARSGMDWILHAIVRRRLSQAHLDELLAELRVELQQNYDRFHLVNAGAREVLDELSERHRLGIIANQPAECRASLERRGLSPYFDIIAISDELDLHKPDVRLYEWAVAEAGCDPARSVMIGDRLDNDVAPAQCVGMRTVLVCWPPSAQRNWCPEEPHASAFLASCDRVALFPGRHAQVTPDAVVASLHELPSAIAELSTGGA